MQFSPPMTMMDFFRKSEGVWFARRNVHHFDSTQDEFGESNLIIDVLATDDPRVLEVCKSQNVDPSLASGGASFNWKDVLEGEEPNPDWAAIIVDIPDTQQQSHRGKFLRNRGYVEGLPVICHYQFADDGVLTISTEYEKNQGQERCWFVSDDFRVRVSTVRMMNGVNLMTYSSERRCLSPAVLAEMAAKHQQ